MRRNRVRATITSRQLSSAGARSIPIRSIMLITATSEIRLSLYNWTACQT